MKFKIVFTFLFLTSMISFSQETEVIKEDNSIEGQFDKIVRISTAYQTYKVIDKDKFQSLKMNVLDSLNKSKKQITEKENLLSTERENIKNLNASLNKTKLDLDAALQNENSVSFFGAQLNKNTYNLIVWFIIILLAAGLGFFAFKFSKSNILTTEAQKNLIDVEQDLDDYRKKAIEREQKLRRQLQDEINKHKSS